MSIASDNPEWFEEWLEVQAANGRFGPEVQSQALNGDFDSYEEWDKLDVDGKLWAEACQDYIERFMHE